MVAEIDVNQTKYHGFQKQKEVGTLTSFIDKKKEEKTQEQELKKILKQLKQRFVNFNLKSENLILILKNHTSQTEAVNSLEKQLKNQSLAPHERQEIISNLLPHIKNFFNHSNTKNDKAISQRSEIKKSSIELKNKTPTALDAMKQANHLLDSISDFCNLSHVSDLMGASPEKAKEAIKMTLYQLHSLGKDLDSFSSNKDLVNLLPRLKTLHSNLLLLQKTPDFSVNNNHEAYLNFGNNIINNNLSFQNIMIAVFLHYQQVVINNMSSQNQQNRDNLKHQKLLIDYEHQKLVDMIHQQQEQIKKNEERSWWDKLIDVIVNVVQVIIGVVEVCIGDEVSGAANILAGACGLAKDLCQILEACHIGNKEAEDKAIEVLTGLSTFFQFVALMTDMFSVLYKPAKLLKEGAVKLIRKGGSDALADAAKVGSSRLAEAAAEGMEKKGIKLLEERMEKQLGKEAEEFIENLSERFNFNPEEGGIELKNMASGEGEEAEFAFEDINAKPKNIQKNIDRATEFFEKSKKQIINRIKQNVMKAAKQAAKDGEEITQEAINQIILMSVSKEIEKTAFRSFRFAGYRAAQAFVEASKLTFDGIIEWQVTGLTYEQEKDAAEREISKNEVDNTKKRTELNQKNQQNEVKFLQAEQQETIKSLQQVGQLNDLIMGG